MSSVVLCAEKLSKSEPYVDALVVAGVAEEAIQVITPENRPADGLQGIGARAGGLLMCGGPDLDPRRYGEEPNPEAGLHVVPELDAIEWDLLTGAAETQRPVFGICRGMQVLNVFFGGSLFQDIQLQLPGVEEHYHRHDPAYRAHEVEVLGADTPMGDLLGRERPQANSRHHQAVKEMGEGFVPVAYSPDGVLEVAQRDADGWWVWSVQWHPENLVDDPQQLELWKRFVAQADAGRQIGSEATIGARQ